MPCLTASFSCWLNMTVSSLTPSCSCHAHTWTCQVSLSLIRWRTDGQTNAHTQRSGLKYICRSIRKFDVGVNLHNNLGLVLGPTPNLTISSLYWHYQKLLNWSSVLALTAPSGRFHGIITQWLIKHFPFSVLECHWARSCRPLCSIWPLEDEVWINILQLVNYHTRGLTFNINLQQSLVSRWSNTRL